MEPIRYLTVKNDSGFLFGNLQWILNRRRVVLNKSSQILTNTRFGYFKLFLYNHLFSLLERRGGGGSGGAAGSQRPGLEGAQMGGRI